MGSAVTVLRVDLVMVGLDLSARHVVLLLPGQEEDLYRPHLVLHLADQTDPPELE